MEYNLPVKIFYYRIRLYPKYKALDPTVELEWKDNNLKRFFRWNWYYKYRAALIQINCPKGTVEIEKGSYLPKTDKEQYEADLRKLKNKISSKKGKITQWSNKIADFENNWNQLFLITEDKNYVIAKEKLFRLQGEYQQLLENQKQLLKEDYGN